MTGGNVIFKIFLLYGVLHLYFLSVNSVSLNSIVLLYCKFCTPDGIGCCSGTLVLPNLAITTLSCAESCQYTSRFGKTYKIIKHFHPNETNSDINPKSQIAVILFSNNINKKTASINLNDKSYRNRTAFVPLLKTNMIPEIKTMVIEDCLDNNRLPNNHYVCTRKLTNDTNLCDQHQGLPLILNNEVIGVFGSSDCLKSQHLFISLRFYCNWVTIVMNNIKKFYHISTIKTSKYRTPAIKMHGVTNASTYETNVTPAPNMEPITTPVTVVPPDPLTDPTQDSTPSFITDTTPDSTPTFITDPTADPSTNPTTYPTIDLISDTTIDYVDYVFTDPIHDPTVDFPPDIWIGTPDTLTDPSTFIAEAVRIDSTPETSIKVKKRKMRPKVQKNLRSTKPAIEPQYEFWSETIANYDDKTDTIRYYSPLQAIPTISTTTTNMYFKSEELISDAGVSDSPDESDKLAAAMKWFSGSFNKTNQTLSILVLTTQRHYDNGEQYFVDLT